VVVLCSGNGPAHFNVQRRERTEDQIATKAHRAWTETGAQVAFEIDRSGAGGAVAAIGAEEHRRTAGADSDASGVDHIIEKRRGGRAADDNLATGVVGDIPQDIALAGEGDGARVGQASLAIRVPCPAMSPVELFSRVWVKSTTPPWSSLIWPWLVFEEPAN